MKKNNNKEVLVSSKYISLTLKHLESLGENRQELLACLGIQEEALENENNFIPFRKACNLITHIENKYNVSGSSLVHGMRLSAANHGMIGIAAITQPSPQEGLSILVSFFKNIVVGVKITEIKEGDYFGVRLHAPLREQTHYIYFAELFFTTVYNNTRTFFGRPDVDIKLRLKYPAPNHFKQYFSVFNGENQCSASLNPIDFSQDHSEILFKSNNLEPQHLLRSNEDLSNNIIEEVQKSALAHNNHNRNKIELNSAIGSTDKPEVFLKQVKHLIESKLKIPRVKDISEELDMPEKVLHHHLHNLGTTLKRIINQVQREKSTHLLKAQHYSISQIAEQLGFSNASSFSKAFKQWNGISPSEYKKKSSTPTNNLDKHERHHE